MRNLLGALALLMTVTLPSTAIGHLPPPVVIPGPPVSADLTERLLKDTEDKKTDTTLEGTILVRYPASTSAAAGIFGGFDISVMVDGLLDTNRISGLWFHCSTDVPNDHEVGINSALQFMSRDFFLFSKDSAMVRTRASMDRPGPAHACYGIPLGVHIETEVVYAAIVDGRVYVDIHTTDTGAEFDTGKEGTGEVGGTLCLKSDRSDKCLP